ncbi:MAG: (d)CMP kinase [Calditrichaceae bacterium]
MAKRITIAIDGPAASGKSTTARLLAKKLGYIYIDTGAMYRAATLAVLEQNIDINDENTVERIVSNSRVTIALADDGQHTFLDEKDVTYLLRSPKIDKAISAVSSYAGVRRVMVEQQRELAGEGGVIMDGRDIGTVVLPDADLKIFMIASIEARANRRVKELMDKGAPVDAEEVRKDISRRDRLDSTRDQSPLRRADDAKDLDTSGLTIEQQVDIIFDWALELQKPAS